MPSGILRGSGQGFGFAIGMVLGFVLVTYATSKAFEAKVASMAEGFDSWLITQTDRLNAEPGGVASGHGHDESTAG